MCKEVILCVACIYRANFLSSHTLQNMKHGNFSRAVITALSITLVCTLACCEHTPLQFRHFAGSRAPKCSSHPCFNVVLSRVSRLLQLFLAHQEGSLLDVTSALNACGRQSSIIQVLLSRSNVLEVVVDLSPAQTKYSSSSAASCSNNVSVSQQYRVLSPMP